MKNVFIFIIFIISQRLFSQTALTAHAGADITQCPGVPVIIGGAPSASGGTPPYTYVWSPSNGLNSSTIANPTANVNGWINYTLTVTDKGGNKATDDMWIHLDEMATYNAGIDTGFCYGQMNGVQIGSSNNSNAGHTFTWHPGLSLNDSTSTNPVATPSVTTVYTLVISNGGSCPDKISHVTVFPWIPPYVDAGPDTIIDEGSVLTLQGTGGTKFWWSPNYAIKYEGTSHPDVWPIHTTTYHLWTEDQHGCTGGDSVVVTVRPGDILFFYNTFTPNNDGNNDVFYIGNLEKFPDNVLKIYNRYDKLIFSATNYDNSWNGKYLGNDVPTGVYFYILDDGKGNKYKGTVTILR